MLGHDPGHFLEHALGFRCHFKHVCTAVVGRALAQHPTVANTRHHLLARRGSWAAEVSRQFGLADAGPDKKYCGSADQVRADLAKSRTAANTIEHLGDGGIQVKANDGDLAPA